MRQTGDALRGYIQHAHKAVEQPWEALGTTTDCKRGNVWAYRVWSILLDSRFAYAGRYQSDNKGHSDPGNPLHTLRWPEAVKCEGPKFTYKGIRFSTRQGVLHWVSHKGRWIPVTAPPSGNCQCCAKQGLTGEELRHWHFQCAR